MALKTLAGINTIDGFAVKEINEGGAMSCADECYVNVHHGDNVVSFKIQNGPIGEKGINGCQVDTMIETATIIVRELNKNFPCRENSLAITKLEESLHWLRARKADRIKRGVEGKNKE